MQETQETWVLSLDWEDPLEEETATHSSILPWEIPWTEEPSGLQSMGSQRVRHDLATLKQQYHLIHFFFLIDFYWSTIVLQSYVTFCSTAK